MKRSNSRFSAILLLALFSGQVLAAPFLSCCKDMQDNGVHSSDPGHGHMAMDGGHAGDAGDAGDAKSAATDDGIQDSPGIPGMAMDMAGGDGNCDHLCEFCLTAYGVALIERESNAISLTPTLGITLHRTASLTTIPDNPFRPPIIA